jgi:hypothetical protein
MFLTGVYQKEHPDGEWGIENALTISDNGNGYESNIYSNYFTWFMNMKIVGSRFNMFQSIGMLTFDLSKC